MTRYKIPDSPVSGRKKRRRER